VARCKLAPAQLCELETVLDAGPAAWGWDEGPVLDAGQDRRDRPPQVRDGLTPWRGWICCCTGSAGAFRSRRARRLSGTRRGSAGGGRRPGRW